MDEVTNTLLSELERLQERLERVRLAIEAEGHDEDKCSTLIRGESKCDCHIARLKAAFYGKEVEGG